MMNADTHADERRWRSKHRGFWLGAGVQGEFSVFSEISKFLNLETDYTPPTSPSPPAISVKPMLIKDKKIMEEMEGLFCGRNVKKPKFPYFPKIHLGRQTPADETPFFPSIPSTFDPDPSK